MDQEYRTIPLTQGQVAIVDAANFASLNCHKWFAHFENSTQSFYAARNVAINGKRTLAWMHRQILGLDRRDGKIGDHVNRDSLDNRKSNLRIVNAQQSVCNRRTPKSSKTGIKGISLNNGSYLVRIGINYKTICLGRRKDLEAARTLYAEGVAKYHGEFGHPG